MEDFNRDFVIALIFGLIVILSLRWMAFSLFRLMDRIEEGEK